MAEETQYTANTSAVVINTANSNVNGTGAIGTVLTAASSGTLVKSVTIKAVGSTTAEGMVRLFVDDGTKTRLILEVEIPVVTKTASDHCFEQYLELDLDLANGYTLKATTQISDTFNIIAEGMNWTYYSGDIRPDSTNYTANNKDIAVITTANTSLTGAGTPNTDIWEVYTAGASSAGYKGSKIESIVIKGTTSSTVDGMIRLFIDIGGTLYLFTEVPVPIWTPSATNRSFFHQINFPGGFNLQADCKIWATTEKSNSFSVIVEGKDWKYPTIATGGLYFANLTPVSGSGTSEVILHSYQVAAGMVASGDLLEVYAGLLVNSGVNTKTFKISVNTSNATAGSTLLAQIVLSTNVSSFISRTFPVVSDTAMECYGGTATGGSQYGASTTSSANVTVPSVSAGFWILITGQKANSGDTDTVRWSMVKNARV